jgi:fatty acid-binding protein DegV
MNKDEIKENLEKIKKETGKELRREDISPLVKVGAITGFITIVALVLKAIIWFILWVLGVD